MIFIRKYSKITHILYCVSDNYTRIIHDEDYIKVRKPTTIYLVKGKLPLTPSKIQWAHDRKHLAFAAPFIMFRNISVFKK